MNVAEWQAFRDLAGVPELKRLVSYFDKHGHEIRIAGGAVRDLVSGKSGGIADVDLATTATPEEMIEMFKIEQVRTINEQGIKHGTVTARIVMDSVAAPEVGENFEVTTLRIDAATSTDGRRPDSVSFTRDWKIDAERRDLTINSMFLSFDGTIHDFFNGRSDLEARRVAFVGNADKRIKEDYLRILRYFRFYGRIADCAENHETSTLEAIADNAEGMSRISGERIWSEYKRILTGKYALSLVHKMSEAKLNTHIGLPAQVNLEEMENVTSRAEENGHILNPATILASLLHSQEELEVAQARLKMSGLERDTATFIIEKRNIGEVDLKTVKCWWVDTKTKSPQKNKAILQEFIKYIGRKELLTEFDATEFPKMPISGPDLIEAQVPKGRVMGILSDMLKERWKESNFQLTKDQLMNMIPDLIDQALEQDRAMRKVDKERSKAGKEKAKMAKKRKSSGSEVKDE